MCRYEFSWPFPAGEVFVTGTFDNWAGSVKLNKNSDGIFSAVVELGDLGEEVEKVFYKYIVDGNWTVNNEANKENDSSGIENNVLYKHEMKTPPSVAEQVPGVQTPPPTPRAAKETPQPVAEPTVQVPTLQVTESVEAQTETVTILPVAPEAEDLATATQVHIFTSSAAPVATTAELAAQVVLVTDEETAVVESPEVQNATVEQIFSISPLPASTTPGNPIHLEPGEPVPKFIPQSAADTVNLDEESYEKADASNFGISAEPPLEQTVITVEQEVVAVPAEIETPKTTVEPVAPEVSAVEETPAAPVLEVVQESLVIASPETSARDVTVEEELIAQPPHIQHTETHLTTGIITEGVAPIVLAASAVKKSVEASIQVLKEVQEVPPVAQLEPEVKAITSEPVSENQPPAPNGTVANRSLLTTPPAAPPTTSTFTTPVPGTTFNVSTTTEKVTSSSSTVSSNNTSRKVSQNEEVGAVLKDKVPEKKKEKRRSVILNKIRNVFKPEQERGISILVSAVMCLLAASLLAGKFEWRSMLELRGRAG